MTVWTYQGRPFSPDMIGQSTGFVYRITHKATGRYYIGQKVFHAKRTLPPLKGQTRKRKKVVQSDWETYFGSSDELNALVMKEGQEAFAREILFICQTKSEMNYIETIQQIHNNVLFDPKSFNGIINFRVSRKHLKNANTLVMNMATHH